MPNGTPVNILSSVKLPSLDDVEKSTFYHFKRGTKHNRENLTWSYEAVRNSCDKDLQAILDAKMLKYDSLQRFGPLYFHQLVYHMTTVDPKAVCAVTQELTNIRIPDLEEGSIAKACKLIRRTLIWLNMIKMLPPDINTIIYDTLETCSVPDFRLFLETYHTNSKLNGTEISVEELLGKTEEQYRILILSMKWNPSKPTSSPFQLQHMNGMQGQGQPQRTWNYPNWVQTPPALDGPQERTHGRELYKWCGTCGRWFFGTRAHFTHEHVQGYRNQGPNTQNVTTQPLPLISSINNVTGTNDCPSSPGLTFKTGTDC